MIYAVITIVALLAILIVAFLTWFFCMKAEGKCPICALKALSMSKFTMNVDDVEDYDNGCTAPLMGWSSWNTLRNHIDEETILQTAKAIKETGLAEAGYKYINLDDCWQSSLRDRDGKLQGDLESFPSGIESLCKRVNEMGLKLGIYSSNGTLTCEDLPASLGNEELDAKTFASWGIEYLKYDFCHHEYIRGTTPIIEHLDFNREGRRCEYRLTPKDASYTGMARTISAPNLPTKQAIGYLNHAAGTASFTLDVENGGEYALTVHYGKAVVHTKQYMQVDINGKIYEVFFPSGKAFTADARVQIKVELKTGENRIKIFNPVVTKADSSYIQYKRMGDALKNASKLWADFTGNPEQPIRYSICEWGYANPWNWGAKAGNMWRTTMDIMANWISIKHIYETNVKLYKASNPGHVNDPDMLEVGNGNLTEDENKSHFTLWCMMAAPLVLGNDIRNMLDGSKKSAEILDILTNKSLILIDQDPLVKAAKRIKKSLTMDILARPLQNGDVAICFFNKSNSKKDIDFDLNTLADEEYLNFTKASGGYNIHDLWSGERFVNDKISTSVAKHGVKVYRISKD